MCWINVLFKLSKNLRGTFEFLCDNINNGVTNGDALVGCVYFVKYDTALFKNSL